MFIKFECFFQQTVFLYLSVIINNEMFVLFPLSLLIMAFTHPGIMDLKVGDMRLLLKKVGKQLAEHDDRVTAEQLLAISQEIKPSKLGHAAISSFHSLLVFLRQIVTTHTLFLVTSGRRLFDYYVTLCGCYSLQEKWRCFLDKTDCEGNYQMCTPEESKPILEEEKNNFLGFCLTTCARVVAKSRSQLFFHTWNAVFHGLSRLGLHVQSVMGFMQKKSTFDTQRQREVDRTDAKLR